MTTAPVDMAFDRWSEAFAADWVRANPQQATVSQYFEGAEQDDLDRRLTLANGYGGTYGASAAEAQAARARRGLEGLRGFARGDLSPSQAVSAAMLERRLRDVVANAPFARYRLVFAQFGGLHVALVTMLATLHPIRNLRDAESYVARLALVAGVLDEGIAEARAAEAAGIVAPDFILVRAIEQLDELTAAAPARHVLTTALSDRLGGLESVPPHAARALVERATYLVGTAVLPAFARVRDLLAGQLPRAANDAGVWRLPGGDAFYAQQLALYTGSSHSPQEVHEIGLREVARIEAEMDVIFKRLGYPDGPIRERVERINLALAPPAEPDPREAIVERLRAIVDDARARSEAFFDLRPRAPVTVEREPAHTEKTAAAHYTVPAADGTKPGIYWVPLADLGPATPWLGIGMKSTAYHEAIPGHHFQLAIQQESPDLPRFRKRGAFGFDASFGEGWALYAEHLAAEFDWYEDDLASRLGYLQMQLFRARRLVVDTGLHAMRWSRQRAIDYGLAVSEVERYIVWPGQACSYMLGQMRILDIRTRARERLGTHFSLKAFHDLVLGNGTLPLDVVAEVIDAWEPETAVPI